MWHFEVCVGFVARVEDQQKGLYGMKSSFMFILGWGSMLGKSTDRTWRVGSVLFVNSYRSLYSLSLPVLTQHLPQPLPPRSLP